MLAWSFALPAVVNSEPATVFSVVIPEEAAAGVSIRCALAAAMDSDSRLVYGRWGQAGKKQKGGSAVILVGLDGRGRTYGGIGRHRHGGGGGGGGCVGGLGWGGSSCAKGG